MKIWLTAWSTIQTDSTTMVGMADHAMKKKKPTAALKFRQASTPGGNPYNLLHKYSTSSDEYADSYYDSGTPRNLSPTSY